MPLARKYKSHLKNKALFSFAQMICRTNYTPRSFPHQTKHQNPLNSFETSMKPYTQSLKSPHSIRGTIICMGRHGGMKSPKSPLNIPKTIGTPIQIQTHILIGLGLNIMKSCCGRNINTSIACQKEDAIFPKSYWDAICMSVK